MTDKRQRNQQLAAAIEESGYTYEALAKATRAVAAESGELLRTSRSAVHYWVAGGTPTGRAPGYLAEALGRKLQRKVTVAELALGCDPVEETMHPDPLAAAADLRRLIVHRRRDFLALAFSTAAVALPLTYDHQAAAAVLRAVANGRRIGAGELETVRQFTEMFRTADERHGGGHGLAAITTYLDDVVTPMLHAGAFPNEEIRASAFGAAAELTTLIGWKCHDAGREGAAQKFYLLAYQFACEGDPTGHTAWTMRALVHQALDLKHPAGCVGLAQAAVERARGKVDRQTEALLLITAARAHGADGDRVTAAKLILAAEDAMLAGGADTIPAYAAAAGPAAATVASHTGRTLTEMGDNKAAERHYRTALDNRRPGTYHRLRGTTLANIAKAVAAQGRYEEAVGLWSQSLDLMEGVASRRNRAELDTMHSALGLYARRGVRGAAELASRAVLLRAE
ncbi:tetratricopeptide repeat protein [Kitasatospora sp. NPDC057542]|uniref:tetratricopeptide repeat protein n=1 Tax=Streptomycetaceae TaxID=2062 RepID=UPI001CCA717B|nr:tetratricopeptide repeat protein [Streptomyces sp. LS1784]